MAIAVRIKSISLLIALAFLAGCAAGPKPQWIEAADVGVISPWQKSGEARTNARNIAIKHAREKLFSDLMLEQVQEGLTVRQLSMMDPVFLSKLAAMVDKAKAEEVPDQMRGLVVMKVQIDKNQVMKLANERVEKDSDLQALLSTKKPDSTPAPAKEQAPQPSAAPSPEEASKTQNPTSPAPAATESPQKTQ